MAAKYCGSCSSKTEYAAKIPLYCSSCGQPFSAAFAKVIPKTISNTSISTTSQTIKRPVKQNLSEEDIENNESDQYDEEEVLNRAQEIAASLSVSDFFSTKQSDERKFSLSDLLDPNKQISVGQRSGVITDPSQLPNLPE
jgi:hypothetical protein